MAWFVEFCNNLIGVFNNLVSFMNTEISGLSNIAHLLGIEGSITPLTLVSTSLVAFLLGSLILRLVRG